MASQEMREAAAEMRAVGLDAVKDIETLRAVMDEMDSLAGLPEDVSHSDFDAGGVPARHVATPGVRDDRGVLYFHGGGYVAGNLNSHTELMSRIARACRAPVLGIDYRRVRAVARLRRCLPCLSDHSDAPRVAGGPRGDGRVLRYRHRLTCRRAGRAMG